MTDSEQTPRHVPAGPVDPNGPASDPGAHVAAYCAAFASGSSALVDRFYEPGAVLVPQPGTPLSGVSERAAAYDHLLGFGVPMKAGTRHLYVAGDIALSIVDWSMRGTARQGFPLDLHGVAADVLRRGADGRWRYLINNPFGTGS
ncbi:nuclear transport factor 2 family protein [Actinoplanes sp. NPDC023801]|uniref:YybH family protein n=1 Tax=Actinoplanes sp. NPDC023801 TaxID=3154595 RepID=UPI0033ECEB0F